MDTSNSKSSDWQAQTVRNTLLLGYWTAAWVASLALATFGPISIWDYRPTLSIMAIALNLALGAGMILANKRHLRGLDEMHQKVQLEAMALSLGVGLVAGLGYSTLDVVDVISFDAEISHLVIIMGLTYAFGVFFGLRKYG